MASIAQVTIFLLLQIKNVSELKNIINHKNVNDQIIDRRIILITKNIVKFGIKIISKNA
jgi:hypothetical protein